MISYKAIDDLEPFFKRDEQMSLEDWLKKLNLTENQFRSVECKYFQSADSEIKIMNTVNHFNKNTYLIIQRQNMPLTTDEITHLKTEIQKLIDELNKK